MHFSPISRDALPAQSYTLFLPWRGLYIGGVDSDAQRVRTTASAQRACTMPEDDARELGARLIRATGEPVELRSPAQ